METLEDHYTYYVQIMGIDENTFWNSDNAFLVNVLRNKKAYDDYLIFKRQQMEKKAEAQRQARRRK